MAWWEQLYHFEIPQSRGTFGPGHEGSRSLALSGVTGTDSYWIPPIGYDLSAYPDDAKLCMWLYIDDVTKLGTSGYIRYGFLPRFETSTPVYYQYDRSDLSTGWNFLSQPLSAFTNVSSRRKENFCHGYFAYSVASATTFYLDDIYISTNGNKEPERNAEYRVKHFSRYDVTTGRNQEFVTDLFPISITFYKQLNQQGRATLIMSWDSLETWLSWFNFYDSIRIYRNGMCIFDGLFIRATIDYDNKNVAVECVSSDYIFSLILNMSIESYGLGTDMELFSFLSSYTHSADEENLATDYQAQGFGIPYISPMGEHASATVEAGFALQRDEIVHPIDMIRKFQSEYKFDYEMRPPMIPNFWYTGKGRDIGITLFQDSHFLLSRIVYNGVDIRTACRALSRGGSSSFVSDSVNSMAANSYGRLIQVISTSSKTQAANDLAASEYVDYYDGPATVFDIELLPGNWIYPWDLGDTITCVVEDEEYSKRIYAMDVKYLEGSEKVRLYLQ